ncbi:MAG: hypothetical protein ABS884_10205, partial [Solibacillus isronensis]
RAFFINGRLHCATRPKVVLCILQSMNILLLTVYLPAKVDTVVNKIWLRWGPGQESPNRLIYPSPGQKEE